MAMGIGQRVQGLVRKAREFWADITEEGATQRHKSERDAELEDAVHQRYGGVRTAGERELSGAIKNQRDESSMDTGPSDALLGNAAARAARSNRAGSTRAQQMQQDSSQTSRQYTQQGGSGSQKTLAEQTGQSPGQPSAQMGAQGTGSEPDTVRGSQSRAPGSGRPNAGGQQSR